MFQSKPNSILKNVLDMLLLPLAVHNPEYKLHPHIITAVHSTLHLYVGGLIQLGTMLKFLYNDGGGNT